MDNPPIRSVLSESPRTFALAVRAAFVYSTWKYKRGLPGLSGRLMIWQPTAPNSNYGDRS